MPRPGLAPSRLLLVIANSDGGRRKSADVFGSRGEAFMQCAVVVFICLQGFRPAVAAEAKAQRQHVDDEGRGRRRRKQIMRNELASAIGRPHHLMTSMVWPEGADRNCDPRGANLKTAS